MGVSTGTALLAAGAAIGGLVLSPVLGMLVWRIPRAEPLLPFARCERPMTKRFPLFELGAALLFGGVALRIGPHADAPAFLYLAAVGWVLVVIDVQVKRLPNALTYPSYPIGLALLGLAAAIDHRGHDFRRALIGMVIFFAAYALLWLIYPAGLGLGDVKLAGVLGLYLGWIGWGAWSVGLIGGFMLGGLLSALLLAIRVVNRKSRIPFGPFMLGGALLAVLFGSALAKAYISHSLS